MEEKAKGGIDAPKKRNKVIVVVLVLAIVASGTAALWYGYLRYWSIEDLAAAVSDSPAAPGFKHSLANKTVLVRGTVTGMEICNTTLGTLLTVELDDFEGMNVVYWDEMDINIGDRVTKEVRFEWSQFNSETHVYSPQIDFPALRTALGIEAVMFAFSHMSDIYWTPSLAVDTARLRIEWLREEVPLEDCNCSLRAGVHSFAVEYVEVLGPYNYGVEIDSVESLSSVVDSDGRIGYDDADGDGNLSAGDSIYVRDLDVPTCESAVQCFMLYMGLGTLTENVSWGYLPLYLPVMERGILRDLDFSCMYAHLDVTSVPRGYRLEVDFSGYPYPWSDVDVMLHCGIDEPIEVFDSETFHPFDEGFGAGSEVTWSSGPVLIAGIVWIVNVTDLDGDGMIGAGDYVTIESDSSDLEDVLGFLKVYILYGPMGCEFASEDLIDN